MYFKKIIKIISIFLLTINLSSLNASEKIVYVDMNKIMSTSLVAQSLKKKLNKYSIRWSGLKTSIFGIKSFKRI